MHRRKLLASAVMITVATLPVVACGSSAGPRTLTGAEALGRAKRSATNTGSYRYETTTDITAPGAKQTLRVTGAYDTVRKVGTGVSDFEGKQIEEVAGGGDMYVRNGAHPWFRLQLDPAVVTKIRSQFDPQQSQLQQFESIAGTLRPSGPTTVDGVATTTYRGDLSLDRLISFMEKLGLFPQSSLDELKASGSQSSGTVDVAVDGQGHMRQATLDLQLTGAGPSIRIDERFHTYDFGKPVHVHVPTASEVSETKAIHSGTDLTAAINDVMNQQTT